MKNFNEIFTHMTFLSQLGISLAAPLLLCLLFCSRLAKEYALGGWIYLPGFFFGLGSSAMTAYKVYLRIMKKQQTGETDSVSCNEHL